MEGIFWWAGVVKEVYGGRTDLRMYLKSKRGLGNK